MNAHLVVDDDNQDTFVLEPPYRDGSTPSQAAIDQPRVRPHPRAEHTRYVRGREIKVKGTIVNSAVAARQLRLAEFTQVLQRTARAESGLRAVVRFTDVESDQLDLVDELNAAMLRRGEQILATRLSDYERLTTDERGQLAMARLRVCIDRSAQRAFDELGIEPPPVDDGPSADDQLAKLESLLFMISLQRLDVFEAHGVRAAFSARNACAAASHKAQSTGASAYPS